MPGGRCAEVGGTGGGSGAPGRGGPEALARTADFFRRPDAIQFNFDFRSIQYALVPDEADASFPVVAVQFYQDRVTATVFSFRTGGWGSLPSFGTPCPWFDLSCFRI